MDFEHVTKHVTLANIERWANTSELDTLFDALRDEDGDGFQSCVIAACDDQLLTFAKTGTRRNANFSRRDWSSGWSSISMHPITCLTNSRELPA